MAINKWQRAVLEQYDDGEFSHLADVSTEDLPSELANCGDSLLRFLMTELSSEEDCASADEALSRLQTAIRQLSALEHPLEELAINEPSAPTPA